MATNWEENNRKSKKRWKDATIGEVRMGGARGRNIEKLARDRKVWKSSNAGKQH